MSDEQQQHEDEQIRRMVEEAGEVFRPPQRPTLVESLIASLRPSEPVPAEAVPQNPPRRRVRSRDDQQLAGRGQIVGFEKRKRKADKQAALKLAAELAARAAGPDWYRTDASWKELDGHTIPIKDLQDRRLYDLIVWATRNLKQQHRTHAKPEDRSVIPRCWLRDRMLYRQLVHEAICRGMSFPKDVFCYLRDYLLNGQTISAIVGPEPWKNPEWQSEQSDTLRAILQKRANADYGKQGRRIDLAPDPTEDPP